MSKSTNLPIFAIEPMLEINNNWCYNILIMSLFGMFGEHTVDNCPLNNKDSRNQVLDSREMLGNTNLLREKYGINKIIGQYHSALEHTFLWVIDANDPHQIQQAAIESGMSRFNTIKIVPLSNYSDVIAKCEKL